MNQGSDYLHEHVSVRRPLQGSANNTEDTAIAIQRPTSFSTIVNIGHSRVGRGN